MENKQCDNCHKSFQITDKDLAFYNLIKVDSPKLCPECRKQRRLVYKNDFTLYQRKCDLCQKEIISMYDKNPSYKVYCNKCWNSDKLDAIEYGQDLDFDKSFFEQFKELQLKVPRVALINNKCENSDYCNFADRNKNCYLLSSANDNEDVYYGFWLVGNKNCIDISYCHDCENCYELVNCKNCYETKYSQLSHDCINCDYMFDCRNCNNCIGCVGLRNASYCIFNKQYSQTDFKSKKKSLYTKIIQKKFDELKIKYPRKYFIGKNIENSKGDGLYNCSNVTNCFNLHNANNIAYSFDSLDIKDCYDINNVQDGELFYEVFSGIGQNYQFAYYCRDSHGLIYCDSCHASKNLFGCVGMRHQENCILNKKYTNQDFQDLKIKVIDHMIKTGEWSESFPVENSPFAYNETMAFNYYPMKKEDVLAKGWKWKDIEKKNNVEQKDMEKCETCNKNFKLIPQESKFYEKYNITKPKKCFDCRHQARLKLENPHYLWQRQCMCTQTDHNHNGQCTNEFETTYSPERKELVYCEQCYNQEIY